MGEDLRETQSPCCRRCSLIFHFPLRNTLILLFLKLSSEVVPSAEGGVGSEGSEASGGPVGSSGLGKVGGVGMD